MVQPSSARRWQDDKLATDVFMPTVKAIMGRIVLAEATAFEDEQHNTDLVVLIARGTRIAVRIRKLTDLSRYGSEITIRSSRPSGTKTELQKIADGWGDWFFYGFGDFVAGKLHAYSVLDLVAFRKRLIVNTPPVRFSDQRNHDGSSTFRAYRLDSLGPSVVVKQFPERA